MMSAMILFLAPAVALLQTTNPVSSFAGKNTLHRSRTHNYQISPRAKFTGLRAGKEEEEDELSSNFLNFLKKTKEIEEDEEDEEEEEITETTETVTKTKENIFKEIASGKSTKFDRVVSDFVGKRYGAGAAFYGARSSDLSEEEYAEMTGVKKGDKTPVEEKQLRDNAILIFGSLDKIGQWVAFELNEKGFQIRVACADKQDAVKIFGLNNVDIIELKKDATQEQYARAVQGAQAVVLCPNFQPKLDFLNGAGMAETTTALSLLELATRAMEAGVGSVKKVVAVSRTIPERNLGSKEGDNVLNAVMQGKSDNKVFSSFRDTHTSFEASIRKAGFEYTIVRAPPLVEEAKEGARSELLILDRKGNPIDSSPTLVSNSVGMLDLTETIVQSLVLDIPNITFTVCESRKSAMERQFIVEAMPLAQSTAMDEEYGITAKPEEASTDRVSRSAYYGILDMQDSDMKSSYLMKPAEIYRAQLEEDEQLEAYWQRKLENVPKDL